DMRHEHTLCAAVEHGQDVAGFAARHAHQYRDTGGTACEYQSIDIDTIEGRMLLIDDHEVETHRAHDFNRMRDRGLDEGTQQRRSRPQALTKVHAKYSFSAVSPMRLRACADGTHCAKLVSASA